MYHLFPASARLSPYVDCFWQSLFDDLGDTGYHELFNAQFTPNLIFNLRTPYHLNDHVIHDTIFHGFNTKPIYYHHEKGNDLFGVRFYPQGVCAFTPVSQYLLCDRIVDASHIFGSVIKDWADQLAETNDISKRVQISERYMHLLLIDKGTMQLENNIILWNALKKNVDNKLGIDALASSLCMTHRSLDRQMNDKIGLSPKKASRIIRFNNVFNMINKVSDNKILFDYHQHGYYDQAHFIKEFKTFTGLSPTNYLASDHFVQNLQSNH